MRTDSLYLQIDGMSCGSCVAHVRSALTGIPGVAVNDVQVGSAVVTLPPNVEERDIDQAIASAGYTLTSVSNR